MAIYDLPITVDELKDGGGYRYLATSPDLPGLIVVGDTVEEVLALAPQVASALIASMKAAGDRIPDALHEVPSPPFAGHVMIPA